jgi:hypothetical protein
MLKIFAIAKEDFKIIAHPNTFDKLKNVSQSFISGVHNRTVRGSANAISTKTIPLSIGFDHSALSFDSDRN